MGGVPLPENESFRALIGEKHLTVIADLAAERADVARQFGVRDLPDVDSWLDIHAGAQKGDGSRPIPSRDEAITLLRDATIGSLVPLSSAADVAGRTVPVTNAMITLASTILGADIASAGRKLEKIGIGADDIDDVRRIIDNLATSARAADAASKPSNRRCLMDKDLASIGAARRAAETGVRSLPKFLGTDPQVIDAMVDAMARAIEPEAKRLGEIAVEETGYGNVEDKRVKNLFNALSIADYLRDVTTLGLLWRDDATKVAAIGEPMGVVAALIPVTNPTSTVIFKVLSAVEGRQRHRHGPPSAAGFVPASRPRKFSPTPPSSWGLPRA